MKSYGMLGSSRYAQARMLNRRSNRPERGQSLQPGVPDDYMVSRKMKAPTVVAQRVSKTTGLKNVKTQQAWKYPGCNILRAPSTLINGRYYTDPKEDDAGDADSQGVAHATKPILGTARRKQESNFLITINPNLKFDSSLDDQARSRFEAALRHLAEDRTLARCLKFGPVSDHYRNDLAHDVLLPGIDFKSTVEVGEMKGRMHTHIILYIEHYSQIQIDPKMMQHEFRSQYNIGVPADSPLRIKTPPYIQVKMLPQSDWTTIMRQYIRKGMIAGSD